jgi:hypothetical protein
MVVVTLTVISVECVALSIVGILKRLAVTALRPTISLLAALTSTGLIAPRLPVIRVTVVPRWAAVAAARRAIAAARSIGVRRFH